MKTVAVIFGGRSAEHDVSIITALSSVIKPLTLSRDYRAIPVYIAKDGSWYSDPALSDIKLYQSDGLREYLQSASPVQLILDGGLVLAGPSLMPGRQRRTRVDVAFPAMHGTYGEDGALMGLLDMAGVPYVGCGLTASAIAMDKVLCKQVTAADGIPSTPWVWFTARDLKADPKAILARIQALHYPLFVKPALLGSSIGITRVAAVSGLMNALEVAAHFGDKIIVEQGVANLVEVTVPIMGNDDPRPAFVEQPLTTPEDFFDFDTKYMAGGKKGAGKQGGAKSGAQGYSQIPANLPPALYAAAEATALRVYRALGCSGIARVDLLIDLEAKLVLFNEVNPLPGSLYAHNWHRRGVSGLRLVTDLLHLAEERHAERGRVQTTFDTSFLKQF
jgi:D-alanine-D-alanine ligase